jgi:uncharacterized lipoprotein YajG
MQKIIKIALIMLGLTLLAGCMPTVALNYSPSPQLLASIDAPAKSRSISVGPIEDVRGTDPSLVYVANNYTSTGVIPIPTYSKEPVAAVIQQGIITALSNANYRVTNGNSDLTLSGELVNLSVTPSGGLTGMIKNQADVSIRMNLLLSNNKTHQMVWHQVVTGSSTYAPGIFYVGTKWVGMAFNNAVSDLISNMMSTPEVRRALLH